MVWPPNRKGNMKWPARHSINPHPGNSNTFLIQAKRAKKFQTFALMMRNTMRSNIHFKDPLLACGFNRIEISVTRLYLLFAKVEMATQPSGDVLPCENPGRRNHKTVDHQSRSEIQFQAKLQDSCRPCARYGSVSLRRPPSTVKSDSCVNSSERRMVEHVK